ncbi:hypothetical protein VTO42DRAFT_4292 [Malbranchea cinnamomea]
MWSCCRSRKPQSGETEPLLPQHENETTLQRRLDEKLRLYEMLRALSRGFLPTTEQCVAQLRVLLASDLLNPNNPGLSLAGRQLARDCRACLRTFMDVLQEKNGKDQLQEFLWQFSQSKASVDRDDLAARASMARARADTAAAYDSVRVVGKLLLTNSDFRRLVNDLSTVGRNIYSDAAGSLSAAAIKASEETAPSEAEQHAVVSGSEEGAEPPSTDQISENVQQVAHATTEALEQTGRDTFQSAKENLSGEQRNALLSRLKQAVINLRNRNDYTTSVSTLSELIQRYGRIYSHAIDVTVSAAEEDVEFNEELRTAIRNLWEFLGTFGDHEEWKRLEESFHKLIRQSEKSPGFKALVDDISVAVHNFLTDPSSLDSANSTIEKIKEKSKEAYSGQARENTDEFLQQLKKTLKSVAQDKSVNRLIKTCKKLADDFSVAYYKDRTTIPADVFHIFIPLLIRAIQHIPIPRVEISEPEMDLLLENIILEPGHTLHNSSFLPVKVLLSTKVDFELRKTHSKEAATAMTNLVTFSMYGLNVSAKEFGYWIRVHCPPFFPYFADEGIASFILDERGIDISVDVEIGRERLEQIVSLRAVRVHIHKLDYEIRKSVFSGLLWILKPFLKHMVRRVLEKKIAEQIVSAFHVLNRELVFARERLRAARITNPADFVTFMHAVFSRMTSKKDPDVSVRVGVDASHRKGVFKDVYAPGSLVKMWYEEERRAEEAIESGEHEREKTWRNDIFDVLPSALHRVLRT